MEPTDDALIMRPAEVDLSGEGFTWEGETFRPGDWVILHQQGWSDEFRWRPHQIGNILASGAGLPVRYSLLGQVGTGLLRQGDRLRLATWEDYDRLMERALEAHPLALSPHVQIGKGKTKKADFDRVNELYGDGTGWADFKRCQKVDPEASHFRGRVCSKIHQDLRLSRGIATWLRGRSGS